LAWRSSIKRRIGGISIRFGPINVQVLSQDKVTR